VSCQRGADEKREENDRKASAGAERTSVSTERDANAGSPAVGLPAAAEAVAAPGSVEPAPWLEGAERVAATGARGKTRVVAAGTGWSKLFDAHGKLIAEAGGAGAAQVLEVVDIDHDGRVAAVIARGLARTAPNAPASVNVRWLDRFTQAEEVPLPPTGRAQIIGVAGDPLRPGVLYIGAFVSKYEVAILRAERGSDGTWTSDALMKQRMAWGLAAADFDGDGKTEIALARVYGDSREEEGDLRLFEVGDPGTVTRVPTVRGARSVLAARDSHGRAFLLFSDGWHRQYRAHALGLLSRARHGGKGWQTEVLANVRGRYSYERLRLGDLDGDGARELIAVGNGPAVRVALDGSPGGGATALGGGDAFDACPVDLDGDGADEVLLVGPDPAGGDRGRAWVWRTGAR